LEKKESVEVSKKEKKGEVAEKAVEVVVAVPAEVQLAADDIEISSLFM